MEATQAAVRGEEEEENPSPPRMQHLFVMRHGDRLDDVDRKWVATAPRAWDPPLTETGKSRARDVGRRLRREGCNITRIFCSPYLRCIQTAKEVVTALCAVDSGDESTDASGQGIPIDPSKVKVSIEFGLCEVQNRSAIRVPNMPLDGPSTLDVKDLEALLPVGTVDTTVMKILPKLPRWPETFDTADQRFMEVVRAVSDMFPEENILCVTHGEAVGISVSSFRSVDVYEVKYCAVSHLQRSVYTFSSPPQAGEFELVTESGEDSGIRFYEPFKKYAFL